MGTNSQLVVYTLGLGLVVTVLYLIARLARARLGLGAGTISMGSLKVVGKRQLEPRKSLYMVEIADRYVLVGTSDQSVSLIDHVTAEEFAAMTAPVQRPTRTFLPGRSTRPVATDDASSREQQFATLRESFGWMLDKARSRRAPLETGTIEHLTDSSVNDDAQAASA